MTLSSLCFVAIFSLSIRVCVDANIQKADKDKDFQKIYCKKNLMLKLTIFI